MLLDVVHGWTGALYNRTVGVPGSIFVLAMGDSLGELTGENARSVGRMGTNLEAILLTFGVTVVEVYPTVNVSFVVGGFGHCRTVPKQYLTHCTGSEGQKTRKGIYLSA